MGQSPWAFVQCVEVVKTHINESLEKQKTKTKEQNKVPSTCLFLLFISNFPFTIHN